jgi:hypothetical protein
MFGIKKRDFHGNAEDRCIRNNNSSIVILRDVSTVTIKGSLRSNGRIYERGLNSKDSLETAAEGSSRVFAEI